MESRECIHRLQSQTEKGSRGWGRTLSLLSMVTNQGFGSLMLFCRANIQDWRAKLQSSFCRLTGPLKDCDQLRNCPCSKCAKAGNKPCLARLLWCVSIFPNQWFPKGLILVDEHYPGLFLPYHFLPFTPTGTDCQHSFQTAESWRQNYWLPK